MAITLGEISGFTAVFSAAVAGIFVIIAAWLNKQSAKLAATISHENAKLQARLTATVKLAEFRQKWIDELRGDMAKFQSLVFTHGFDGSDHTGNPELYELGMRIELRLNPCDINYQELHRTMYNFVREYGVKNKVETNIRYLEVCQKILKSEWDVLKAEVRDI